MVGEPRLVHQIGPANDVSDVESAGGVDEGEEPLLGELERSPLILGGEASDVSCCKCACGHEQYDDHGMERPGFKCSLSAIRFVGYDVARGANAIGREHHECPRNGGTCGIPLLRIVQVRTKLPEWH